MSAENQEVTEDRLNDQLVVGLDKAERFIVENAIQISDTTAELLENAKISPTDENLINAETALFRLVQDKKDDESVMVRKYLDAIVKR